MKQKKDLFLGLLIAASLMLTIGCDLTESGSGDPTPTAVTFESAVQTGGTSGTADSTGLTLTFSVDPTSLAAGDITVTGATKGALSGTGTTRSFAISDITVANGGTVSVAITSPSGFTLTGSPKTAVVYRIVYGLRDTGPAGGLIFYINPNYATDGWMYLEAWTADESGTYLWKTANTSTAGTLTAIGTGYANTYTYMTGAEHPAAEVCRNANHGGYEDWFLPSKDESEQMYVNLHQESVGGFASGSYWSSSEFDSSNAWFQSFLNGSRNADGKNLNIRVRAVRAF